MIKFEHTEVMGWEHAIRGCRNPMNSWDRSDSGRCEDFQCELLDGTSGYLSDNRPICPLKNAYECELTGDYIIGPNDLDLMKRLRNAGTDHRKFMRMITVYVDITAPLYWWKEFDTYKVGTVANSCSTMHKIHAKEFELDDFSHEHLDGVSRDMFMQNDNDQPYFFCSFEDVLYIQIETLNRARKLYLETKDKKYWWQMIQLLPSSYNQKRTVMLNYEVLAHIWNGRRRHKLDEWAEHPVTITKLDIQSVGLTKDGLGVRGPIETKQKYFGFCDWIKTLPYSELITGIEPEKKQVCKDCFGAEMDDCEKCPHNSKKEDD